MIGCVMTQAQIDKFEELDVMSLITVQIGSQPVECVVMEKDRHPKTKEYYLSLMPFVVGEDTSRGEVSSEDGYSDVAMLMNKLKRLEQPRRELYTRLMNRVLDCGLECMGNEVKRE